MTITEPTKAQSKPLSSRPYAKLTKSEPSVTTLIGLLDKPGLSWGAAKETALFAVHHQDEWMDMDPSEAVNRLRLHHKGVWDSAKNMGSLVHSVMESWINGETPNIGALVADVAAWRNQAEAKLAEANDYVDGLERFFNECSPEGFTTEVVVAKPGFYVGTRDLFGTITLPGTDRKVTALLDLKTTANKKEGSAVYGREWALQLAAYNYAPEIRNYARDRSGKVIIESTEPNEPADFCGIVQLRGDGKYQLYEIPMSVELYDTVLSLSELAKALKTNISTPILSNEMEGL